MVSIVLSHVPDPVDPPPPPPGRPTVFTVDITKLPDDNIGSVMLIDPNNTSYSLVKDGISTSTHEIWKSAGIMVMQNMLGTWNTKVGWGRMDTASNLVHT